MSETIETAASPLPPVRGGQTTGKAGKEEKWALGLISSGHFLSHFYGLTLPPLFLFLKAEFNVSYTELGLIMTAYGLLGGVAQAPVGFLVDRVGPRRVLLAGLGLNVCAVLLMGFTGAYWMLLVLAVFAGLGNSVFHPADYAILSGSVRSERLGRAFSIHTFSGFLGGACAPVAILILAQWSNWRAALIVVGIAGLAVWLVLALRREVLRGEPPAKPLEAHGNPAGDVVSAPQSGMRLLLTAPVLLFLAFFVFYGMCSGGLIAFTVTGLINLHGLSLGDANAALTGHLFGVVGGILLAGIIADRYPRHLVIVGGALLLTAAAAVLPAFLSVPGPILVAIMVLAGLGLGAVLPPRDLMVRALIPPGQTGKVFGFVFVGFSIGVSAAPLLFGWFLDTNQPALVFVFAALFAALALIAIAGVHWLTTCRETSNSTGTA